jgi:hypothetical protein
MFQLIFRPLQQWPGPMTRSRNRSRFKASYNSTIRQLERELLHLRARQAVIQVALSERDIRQDGLPRSGSRPSHPGVILSFNSRHGPLSYPCDTFQDWEDNLRAIVLSLEHLRAVDRYGVTKRGEQYTGWAALPPPAAKRDAAAARRLLDSYGGENAAILKTHPDRGGSAEAFHKVQEAREILGLA